MNFVFHHLNTSFPYRYSRGAGLALLKIIAGAGQINSITPNPSPSLKKIFIRTMLGGAARKAAEKAAKATACQSRPISVKASINESILDANLPRPGEMITSDKQEALDALSILNSSTRHAKQGAQPGSLYSYPQYHKAVLTKDATDNFTVVASETHSASVPGKTTVPIPLSMRKQNPEWDGSRPSYLCLDPNQHEIVDRFIIVEKVVANEGTPEEKDLRAATRYVKREKKLSSKVDTPLDHEEFTKYNDEK